MHICFGMFKFKNKMISCMGSAALAIGLVLGMIAPVNAADGMDADELFAVELINWIRLDPVTYARALGYDPHVLLADPPWLSGAAAGPFPALAITENLILRAEQENTYLSGVKEADEDLPAFETDYARTGEITGTVSSIHFIEPRRAVRIVIDNQLKRELDPGFTGQRSILNSQLDLAGVSLTAGGSLQAPIFGSRYEVAIAMGSSTLKKQRQILNLINQLRANPATYRIVLGFPGRKEAYTPLFFNSTLQAFVKTPFVDTDNFVIHAKNFEYSGLGLSKASAIKTFPKISQDMAVNGVFLSWMISELRQGSSSSVLFGGNYNDAGINFVYVNGNTNDHIKFTIVAGLNESESSGFSRVYGLVYADLNFNTAYTPGEGRAGRVVSIHDPVTFASLGTVITDNAGSFTASLPSGKRYLFITGEGETAVAKEAVVNSDIFLSLQVVEDR